LHTKEWFGGFLPLFIALIIGVVTGISLTAAARRLCGLTGSWRFSWDSLTQQVPRRSPASSSEACRSASCSRSMISCGRETGPA
jgi:hypothetical protein